MITPINKVTKEKERKLLFIDTIRDLDQISFSSLLPPAAKKVEITIKPARDGSQHYVVEVDYILTLTIEELTQEEVIKNEQPRTTDDRAAEGKTAELVNPKQ